jgi:hypothetical protein
MQSKAHQIVINAFEDEWEKIPFKPPVGWETKVGYKGNGRFVSLYWCATTYEVIIYDGAARYNGNLETWLKWTLAYPEIYQHLGDRSFGYLFEPPTHALLIDRLTRSTYITKLSMLAYVSMDSTLSPSKHPP